uniref:ZT_dimer domain-containing protein n=1 Tax=Echinostoma caproni TaxID=27848 RepID=A0A183B9A2_9TREM
LKRERQVRLHNFYAGQSVNNQEPQNSSNKHVDDISLMHLIDFHQLACLLFLLNCIFASNKSLTYSCAVQLFLIPSQVDIVLPMGMCLKEAHDIGEELQKKLERLENVERAFVHLDYEFTHHPESEHKIA